MYMRNSGITGGKMKDLLLFIIFKCCLLAMIDHKILTTKPREESGSKTSRKYAFQKDLSLYLLLEEHEKRSDYLFLFDFHEDLIISNSSTALKDLEFFQIKTKDSGNWTTAALTKREKDKNSILGKLYHNRILFESFAAKLNLISNARYSFNKLKNGDDPLMKIVVEAKNLCSKDLESHENCIKAEHSLTETDYEPLTSFRVTDLSNTDSTRHCVGVLATLINRINPSNAINPELAYKQVMNEIARRTNATVGDKSFSQIREILELKGISKIQFLDFLKKAGLYKSVSDEWIEIKDSLESNSVPYMEVLKFKSAWRDMNARVIKDSNSIPLRDLQNEISSYLKTSGMKFKSTKMIEIINEIYASLNHLHFDEYFTKCLIIKNLNGSES
jgi:hypothetical protein